MVRALLVPTLALLFAGAPVAAAADDAPAPIQATLDKRSKIRFGPTTSAREVVTLNAGTPVEVFGLSKSSADWYVIRFPKEGRVWIHTKNLKAIDGGARHVVTEDRTRARNDSTLSGDVVAELGKGEIVEDKGLVNGDWRAVNIPDAVAYVHKSLVTMPADVQKALDERARTAETADAAWQKAMASYAQWLELVKANPKAALGLDWAGLAGQLDTVIAGHASASTRIAAKRVRESIAALLPAAIVVAQANNVAPPAPLPTAQPVEVKPAEVKPATAGTAAVTPPPMTDAQMREILKNASPWAAEGILVQDDQYLAKVGTRELLMNGNGDVVAFIKAKDGVDLKLSELLNREVGAKGEVLTIAPAQSGLPGPVKLIIATEAAPAR